MSKNSRQINNLRDLVQFGIELHTMSVPRGFIVKVRLPKSIKEQVFSDLVDYGVGYKYSQSNNRYKFDILGMKFEVGLLK